MDDFDTLRQVRANPSLVDFRRVMALLALRTGQSLNQAVDFVIEHGRRVVGIEVKMTDAPGYRHAAGLVRFLGEHPQTVGGILLHGGQ